jgi:hypothetical protein
VVARRGHGDLVHVGVAEDGIRRGKAPAGVPVDADPVEVEEGVAGPELTQRRHVIGDAVVAQGGDQPTPLGRIGAEEQRGRTPTNGSRRKTGPCSSGFSDRGRSRIEGDRGVVDSHGLKSADQADKISP